MVSNVSDPSLELEQSTRNEKGSSVLHQHRPWRCKCEHRKEPGFSQGSQMKIPAPLFPASKMSDAALPSPLHISWPFVLQQRENSTHAIKIILRLAFPGPTPQKSCDTAEPDHNQHLKSLRSACVYGGKKTHQFSLKISQNVP